MLRAYTQLQEQLSSLDIKAAMIRMCLREMDKKVISDPMELPQVSARVRTRSSDPVIDASMLESYQRAVGETSGPPTWEMLSSELALDVNTEYPVLGQYKPLMKRKRGGTHHSSHAVAVVQIWGRRLRVRTLTSSAVSGLAYVWCAETLEEKLATLSAAKAARRLKHHPETADGSAIGSGAPHPSAHYARREA